MGATPGQPKKVTQEQRDGKSNNQRLSCSICYDEVQQADVMSCQCNGIYCQQCLTNWCFTQTESLSFNSESLFLCPTPGCASQKTRYQILEILPPISKELFTAKLTNTYLNTTKDIRRCPNTKCSYAGVLEESGPCWDPLSCESCGYKWRDPSNQYPIEHFINKFLVGEMRSLVSAAHTWVTANECPNCSINICKTGGCAHMVCSKCQYEFCWYCKHHWKSHNATLCSVSRTLKASFFSVLLISIFGSLGFYFDLAGFLFMWFGMLLTVLFKVVVFLISFLFIHGFLFAFTAYFAYQTLNSVRAIANRREKNRTSRLLVLLKSSVILGLDLYLLNYLQLLNWWQITALLVPIPYMGIKSICGF